MVAQNLEQLLQDVQDPAEYFRTNALEYNQYIFPPQYTHWIEEQRAVRESVAVVDQSYHMTILLIEGPDATDFLESLCINSFENVRTGEPPRAKNIVMCNPDGYIIGDQILFHLGENRFTSVGSVWANNWIRYNGEVTDFDVETSVKYTPHEDYAAEEDAEDPYEFRFQVQGPDALDVIEAITDHPLPDISFFEMDGIEIDGIETHALGHGMAAMPGLEIFGDYEHHDHVLDRILEAGEPYGIRRMGTKAYKTGKIGSGWIVVPVPAIYVHEDMQGYREWLPPDRWEGELSIGGSFAVEDITDYYMNPIERGQGHLIAFDHDFIGREALERMVDEPQRERVTFVWNSEDVVDVYESLFGEGPSNKHLDLPDTATQWSTTHYDVVLKDGTEVGWSKYPGYLYYEREMLSLGTIDAEYAKPGTEVSFIWGDESGKSSVERHEPCEIRATVGPAPYVRGGREEM